MMAGDTESSQELSHHVQPVIKSYCPFTGVQDARGGVQALLAQAA